MGFFDFRKKEKRNTDEICEQVTAVSQPVFSPKLNNFNLGQKLATVHRCVEVISNSVAQLPLEPYYITENDRIKYKTHVTYNLLNRFPNRRMTRFTFLKMIISSMLLRGNAYAYIRRDSSGNIIDLLYIPSELVTVQTPTGDADIFSDITYSIVGFNRVLEHDEILHFMNFTHNGIEGISTLRQASMTINVALHSENAARGYFEGGGHVSGILTSSMPINAKSREDIKKSWTEAYRTADQYGVVVLGKELTFQPITINPADVQLLQSREFNVIEICRFFGVSPVIAFDYTKSNYSTVEATQLGFLTETLSPILEKLELEFEKKLYRQGERDYIDVRFDVRKLMRADIKSQAEYYSKLFNIGVLSINDIREEIDMKNVGEHGDKRFVQVNMQDISVPFAAVATPQNNNQS